MSPHAICDVVRLVAVQACPTVHQAPSSTREADCMRASQIDITGKSSHTYSSSVSSSPAKLLRSRATSGCCAPKLAIVDGQRAAHQRLGLGHPVGGLQRPHRVRTPATLVCTTRASYAQASAKGTTCGDSGAYDKTTAQPRQLSYRRKPYLLIH